LKDDYRRYLLVIYRDMSKGCGNKGISHHPRGADKFRTIVERARILGQGQRKTLWPADRARVTMRPRLILGQRVL
jgi:hypothetical protein